MRLFIMLVFRLTSPYYHRCYNLSLFEILIVTALNFVFQIFGTLRNSVHDVASRPASGNHATQPCGVVSQSVMHPWKALSVEQ